MKPTWHDIVEEPFVGLIIGSRGSGKTALSHALLEEFESDERDPYIIGFPESKTDLLPDRVELLPEDIQMAEWPEDSVVLLHESQLFLHARRSMDAENLEIDKLVTVSRHKNSDVIFETQMSNRLDRNAAAAVDMIVSRWPALMQAEFERKQIRSIIKETKSVLSEYVTEITEDGYEYIEFDTDDDGVELIKKHAYVHADRFRGEYPHEIGLADHWSEGISKAYGDMAPGDTEDGDGLGDHSKGHTSIREAAEAANTTDPWS